jgi:hypothetical protein
MPAIRGIAQTRPHSGEAEAPGVRLIGKVSLAHANVSAHSSVANAQKAQ